MTQGLTLGYRVSLYNVILSKYSFLPLIAEMRYDYSKHFVVKFYSECYLSFAPPPKPVLRFDLEVKYFIIKGYALL